MRITNGVGGWIQYPASSIQDRAGGERTLVLVVRFDAEPMDHLVESGGAQIEKPGRPTLDAIRPLEGFADEALLVVRHRFAEIDAVGWKLGHRLNSGDVATNRLRQLVEFDRVMSAEHDRTLDRVLELAHVPRPVILREGIHRRRREALDFALVFLTVDAQEMRRQEGYVVTAITQRRHLDRDDVEAVIEILAEVPLLDLLPKICVGCRHQPGIDRFGINATDAPDLAFLDDPQQLGLGI